MTTPELKKEILSMVSILKKEGKVYLAKAISKNWQKTMLAYSANINAHKPDKPMENTFKKALAMELSRLLYPQKEILEIIKDLEKHRVLQTSPHISPAGKPRFFFINWLASLSFSPKRIFPVAMFSGVPFSNKTRPGRLCKKGGDINLMPSSMQDELVYKNKIPEKMITEIKNLPPKLKNLIPEAKIGNSYTAWALECSQKLEGKFLQGKSVFFDFNEVASNYLLLSLKDPEHPISKMFFSPMERKMTIKNFKEMVFFYAPVQKGKYEETESFFLKDGYLESASRKIELNPDTLIKELKDRLCPGLIVGFLIFAFLNHFQCFGSFAQTEYLPLYRDRFAKFPFLKKYNLKKAPTGELTTGGFPFDVHLHPLDIYLDSKFNPDPNTLFGEALLTIKDVLLHQNYSMNLVRK
ncbi:MAG: hypothetical protein V1484_02530 [bacterium]